MRKQWLSQSLIINKKEYSLYDFSDDEFIAEKIKREALDDGAQYAKIIMRKSAYFEEYPSGRCYNQKVYAVYAIFGEPDE